MNKKKWAQASIAAMLTAAVLTGCGTQKQVQQAPVKVNVFKAVAENTPITAEYSGTVSALNQVAVQARVSGRIVEKFVEGGQYVEAGQPLYRIDSRPYTTALANAQATQAKSAADLANQQLQLERYRILASEDAIAKQTLDTQESAARQSEAVVAANAALVQAAQDDLDDTIVRAPFSGKLSVDDLPIGTYVTAGQTALVTMSSENPVYVEFSLTEAEYLQLVKSKAGGEWGDHLKLRLSDGSIYEQEGHVVQINQQMVGSTGSLIIKAQFPNPNRILIPGLYATVISDTQIQPNAILVPQRAVQQTLGRYFISVIDADGKAVQRPVTPGAIVGNYWVITSGINAGDTVIVDGYQKANNAAALETTELTKADIDKKE